MRSETKRARPTDPAYAGLSAESDARDWLLVTAPDHGTVGSLTTREMRNSATIPVVGVGIHRALMFGQGRMNVSSICIT